MRILFVGGNSGGHLFPLVAVWHEVEKLNPDALAQFICSEKPEDYAMLEQKHCPITQIETPRMNLSLPATFLKDLRLAGEVLDGFKPDVVFIKGGAVSVPVCRAAKSRNIPIILHESDAVMGRANRMIARWAKTVCLGLSHPPVTSNQSPVTGVLVTGSASKAQKFVSTGNPLRAEISEGDKAKGFAITKLSGKRPILLVTGGSQGAQALNDWVITHLDEVLKHANVIHLTGKGKAGAKPREGYFSLPFALNQLPHLYALADMAISRAGASNIGELAINGIPTILVPLRGLAQDHQEWNARAAEESGGCIRIEQEELEKLLPAIISLATDDAKRATMSKTIRALANPDAARRIAEMLMACVATA